LGTGNMEKDHERSLTRLFVRYQPFEYPTGMHYSGTENRSVCRTLGVMVLR
jgi:hypothetical protein